MGLKNKVLNLGFGKVGQTAEKLTKNCQLIFTPVSMALCALGSQNLVHMLLSRDNAIY